MKMGYAFLVLIGFFTLTSMIVLHNQIFSQQANHNNESIDNGVPLKERHRPIAFDIGQLKQQQLAHGTFFFGPHSHEVDFAAGYKPLLNSIQKEFLNDNIIQVEKEVERCARYNFKIANQTHLKRRRLFFGSLLADDSMEVLQAVGTEFYNVFHTVSFIESNKSQNLTPRKWKYYNPAEAPESLITLHQLFGPQTKVSVDYYVPVFIKMDSIDDLLVEFLQREGSTQRWAFNGMREDDIGIISDADDIFTRDFLRALQICDVPEFRPNQDCRNPKVIGSTMVFESSPNCVTMDRRWHHPDAILGECVMHVGNASLHPPGQREYKERHGMRLEGYGNNGNYSNYVEDMGSDISYPLWHAVDFRMQEGGKMYEMIDGSPTGYHFHNFFMSSDEVRNKYATYGHAWGELAFKIPLWALSEDIQLGFDCANGEDSLVFDSTGSSVIPLYYANDDVRTKRHQHWQNIVRSEEEYWQKMLDAMQDLENDGKSCWSECGERFGKCPFFCGKKGVCCEVGAENLHPDCAGGALGCTDRDCCVNGAAMLYHNQ